MKQTSALPAHGSEDSLKPTIMTVVALLIGAAGGGALVAHRDAVEMEKRAHHARALFRVAGRYVGHDKLITEWRTEAAQEESPSQ